MMGKISWRAKHASGKTRQAVHLVAAGVFVFQTHGAFFWNQWLGIPYAPTAVLLAAMLLASAFAFAMLFVQRAPAAPRGLRF